MSETTPLEGLPFPCLGDPFQRHWIQDLATAADLTLNRIKSDVDLIDRRPRGQMELVSSTQSVTQNVFTFLNTNQIDYSIRMGATTGTPGFFAPDFPGLYYCALELSWTNDSNITKINPEVVTCDSSGVNLVTHFGRSFNQHQAQGIPIARLSGLAHLANVSHQIRARVRHQGTVAMSVGFMALTAQYLGGCRNQLLPNPYFERNANGWTNDTAGVSVAQSSAFAFRGNYSLAVSATPATTSVQIKTTPRFAVTAGRVYHAIVYLYTTVSENYNWGFRWFDAAGVSTGVNFTATIASTANGWKRYAITATAPALTVSSEMRFSRQTLTAPAPVFYIDDAEVFEFC